MPWYRAPALELPQSPSVQSCASRQRDDSPALASLASGAPKIFESFLAQFRVARRVLDGAMAEPILNGPRVVPHIGQGIAASVPQHVHVNLEGKPCALADVLDQAIDGIGG